MIYRGLAGDQLLERVTRVKPAQDRDGTAALQSNSGRRRQTVEIAERQTDDRDICRANAPHLRQRRGRIYLRRVAEDDALRRAGRARRVDNQEVRVRIDIRKVVCGSAVT